jgi:uncharacterized membrane protein YkoI
MELRSKRVALPTIAAVAVLGIGATVWTATASGDVRGSERDRVASAATQAVGGTAVDVETSDDLGEAYEVEVRLDDGSETDVGLDQDLNVVSQDADDDSDDVWGSERDRVASAATQAVGGTAVDVDTSDDLGAAYEVEVRLDNGSETDVTLDQDLNVVSQDADDDRDEADDLDDRDDRLLSGSERTSVERAALSAVGGGTVLEVEADDDRGEAYEVEVRDTDYVEWDLTLDADLTVLSKSADD